MVVKITLDDREVQLTMNKLVKGITDTKPVMKDINEELLKYYSDEVFRNQGVDKKWVPLSLRTRMARDKRRGYYRNAPETTNQILVWTGRLKRGFEGLVETAKVTISNKVPYFKYHQQGGKRLPQRKMLEITQKTVDIVNETFEKYINKLLK